MAQSLSTIVAINQELPQDEYKVNLYLLIKMHISAIIIISNYFIWCLEKTSVTCLLMADGHVCSACSVGVLLFKAEALKMHYLVSYL